MGWDVLGGLERVVCWCGVVLWAGWLAGWGWRLLFATDGLARWRKEEVSGVGNLRSLRLGVAEKSS